MSEDVKREGSDPEPEPAVAPVAVFHQLDPAAVKLWRFEGLTTVGVLLFAAIVTLSVLWLLSLVPGWVALLVWAVLGSFLYLSTIWHPPRRYAAWSYRLSEQVLELRYGVVWRTSMMIPLTRLQHVDLKRGPLDRRLGVASLEIHTAGTSHASHEIPCLDHETGLGLRERLIAAADLYSE
jgi:membrane protein YdbS with pleckstrin-like domain